LFNYRFSGAHACSEIGQKWFLFALHNLGTALGFVSVLDFLGVLSFPKTGEMGKPELKPFLTILGTGMRARLGRPSHLMQTLDVSGLA
jgi:hypothetical protein